MVATLTRKSSVCWQSLVRRIYTFTLQRQAAMLLGLAVPDGV
jgi:hypothetical protein